MFDPSMRAAALALLLGVGCSSSNICSSHVCRYDPNDGGPCHTGPALCCGDEDLASSEPTRACGDVGTAVSADEVKGCVDDQQVFGGCQ